MKRSEKKREGEITRKRDRQIKKKKLSIRMIRKEEKRCEGRMEEEEKEKRDKEGE